LGRTSNVPATPRGDCGVSVGEVARLRGSPPRMIKAGERYNVAADGIVVDVLLVHVVGSDLVLEILDCSVGTAVIQSNTAAASSVPESLALLVGRLRIDQVCERDSFAEGNAVANAFVDFFSASVKVGAVHTVWSALWYDIGCSEGCWE
jgi:hypothetical protein